MISNASASPKLSSSAPSATDVRAVGDRVKAASRTLADLRHELEKVIVGQRALLDRILIALLANGHILIEGVPGLAKTTTVATLAKAIHARFQRIQFTPDLLPADLTGTQIYNPKTGDFSVKKGPVFANIVLADEINRAPAKVQSALLEAMQERQVTIGGETFPLPEPFLVLATENPIEQEGTYPLPEAQVDRFMMKILVTYPSSSEEREILDRQLAPAGMAEVKPVITPDEIARLRDSLRGGLRRRQDPTVLRLARAGDTRPEGIQARYRTARRLRRFAARDDLAGSGARAHAFLQGRGFVTPQDVKAIAPDVLRHRLILSYEAEAEEITPDAIVGRILDQVGVPWIPTDVFRRIAGSPDPDCTGRTSRTSSPAPICRVFSGRGIEFDEVRPYVARRRRAGDRLERDRATGGRSSRIIEERELTILLLVDISRSLHFGSSAGSSPRSRPSFARSSPSRPCARMTRWAASCFRTGSTHTFPRARGGVTRSASCARCSLRPESRSRVAALEGRTSPRRSSMRSGYRSAAP